MRLISLVIFAILISVCIDGSLAAKKKKNKSNKTAAKKKNNKIESRIVGGKSTTVGNAKYIVYLRRDGYFTCGASLIAPRKVLTAAHCVEGVSASRLTVHGGTSYLSNEGVKRAVTRVAVSPNFKRTIMTNDVAVLTLASAMTGPNISPIGLSSRTPKIGSTVKVSGWGLTNVNGRSVSNQLRTVNVKMLKRSNCQRRYRGQATITASMICATVPGGGKDACSGDSGGPLVQNGKLAGIISWGIGCANRNYPGVYTSVNNKNVRAFINKQLRN